MIKTTIALLMVCVATNVYAQKVYTNLGSSGERDRGTIYVTTVVKTSDVTPSKVPSQSFIDGQYQFLPVPNPDRQPSVQMIPYNPDPFANSVRLENPTPLPSHHMPYSIPNYYGGATTYWSTAPPVIVPYYISPSPYGAPPYIPPIRSRRR